MDSNQENEVRQQRLSLTWHGTNEGGSYKELAGEAMPTEEPKPPTGGLKILKRPADITPANVEGDLLDEIAAELADDAAVQSEIAIPQTEAEPEEETVVVAAPKEPAEKERVTLVAPTPAIADVPAVADAADEGDATAKQILEDVTATATLLVDGDEQDDPDIEESITCSQRLRSGITTVAQMNDDDLDQDDGATATIPAISPAGIHEEFTTERETMPEEQAPRKVVLSKMSSGAAANRPKPALTVDRDENEITNRLKIRKAPAIKTTNTCKMKPDNTQEIVAGAGLGDRLRIAREASQLNLFEVAEKTRISSEYISALEEERFEGLPLAAIYIKSYLKTLARCYGIDADELICEYEERTGAARANEQQAHARKTTDAPGEKDSDVRNAKWISWAIGAVAAIVVIVLVAGVLVNKRIGRLSETELSIVSDAELRGMVSQEFLPFRVQQIPTRETAALNR